MDTRDLEYAFTEPLREFARKRGISPTTVYSWIASGEVESFLEGHRRHIVLSSYDRMVRRRVSDQAGAKLPSSNPKITAQQIAAQGTRDSAAAPVNQRGRRSVTSEETD